eukprot:GHVU01138705.1.p5 GENE.GHVU01138705.1~~GHVU01138705.1.p5  ORF type:complete len:103 (-),score=6.81 GHVU01138705.1:379-687(-)
MGCQQSFTIDRDRGIRSTWLRRCMCGMLSCVSSTRLDERPFIHPFAAGGTLYVLPRRMGAERAARQLNVEVNHFRVEFSILCCLTVAASKEARRVLGLRSSP